MTCLLLSCSSATVGINEVRESFIRTPSLVVRGVRVLRGETNEGCGSLSKGKKTTKLWMTSFRRPVSYFFGLHPFFAAIGSGLLIDVGGAMVVEVYGCDVAIG